MGTARGRKVGSAARGGRGDVRGERAGAGEAMRAAFYPITWREFVKQEIAV